MPSVIIERRSNVLYIGLNRPEKRNAFNVEMLEELGRAYQRLETDDNLRAGVLYAHGDNFTAGLDLAEVGPRLVEGSLDWPAEALRMGLVQEVVEPGDQLDRAAELAERIATRSAPLAVRTTLAAAQRANRDGERAAEDRFVDDVAALFKTKDGAEGMLSFIERRPARFVGA